ncbi:efflux RND transporter permease subunit [Neiella marina]|uniref:Efflux RND transporter permease subunit n=1 Tax=Neiella holothuriorum TaxID=2870530 RepID=A0ABS7EBN7_9GAMM|nr:efflux RND transporter permease subunit [Neiella holothuriorum]MBW8189741.1 efflux RND transporter permease subunit [Neiella holothuriorum]
MSQSQPPHSSGPLPSTNDAIAGSGLISWFAQNPVAANLLLISVLILGVLAAGQLRKEAFPSLEPDRITVSMNYDSGDALLAEEGIALKVEEALETVPGIKRITSTSNAYGSTVMIEKKTDYSLDTLLTDVKNEVDAIYNLPVDAENPVIEKARRQDHAIWVQLYGDADMGTLQELAERLKSDLLAKSAISDLSISAKQDPLISIEIDEAKLLSYGLTMGDVADAVNAESSTPLSTSLRYQEKVLRLKASEQAYRQKAFADIPLFTTANGSVIRLGDVALVTDTFEDDVYSLSHYNQQNGMGIQIVMDEQSDVIDIVQQAQEVVDNWNERGILPNNVELLTWYDQSDLIKERLSLLSKNAITGIALVFIVLALFLNLTVAFWVAAGLPFIFCGTLFFMGDSFVGLTINELTTFGFIMALGIVVDDAVVVGESIYDSRKRQGDSLANTIRGTMQVAVPTLFGVLTTVAAFVALSNVTGRLGQIYAQFASVVTICLLLSVVESKLILPCHLAHLNTHRTIKKGVLGYWSKIQHGADAGLQWFNDRVYRPIIEWSLRLRYAVLLAFVTLFILVVGMPMTGAVRVGFFPDIAGDLVVATVSMQNDASFGQTETNLGRIEQAALQADAQLMDKYQLEESSLTSLQVLATGDLEGEVKVELASDSAYSSREYGKVWQQLTGSLEGVRKLKFLSKKEMVDNFKVELKSWDEQTVTAAGERFKDVLASMNGISGIDDNLDPGQPQLKFELTEQGRALGLDTATLSQHLLRTFGGDIVQRYQRNKDEVKVRVRLPQEKRQTLADIEQSHIRLTDGTVVSMNTVARISTEYQQDSITRIDNLRAAYISAVVDSSVLASNELVDRLQQSLVPELLAQYPDLTIDFAGEAEHQQEATSSMSQMFVMALLAIYVLLAIPLKSYIQPVLIMLAIPFGIVGAILGHWLNDLTISILSLNGILALSGVVVNDSLLLVSRFNQIRRERDISIHDAIVEACRGRLRAVLLTSVTTFAGLAPLLSETSMQAQFLIPAAASLGYGILFATLITLVLIPALLTIQLECKAALQNGWQRAQTRLLGMA